MGRRNNKKLCGNCDGTIDLEVDLCPYCGTHLNLSSSSFKLSHPSFEAPYSMKASAIEETPPPPPYMGENSQLPLAEERREEKKISLLEERKQTVALILFLPGVIFFLFGMTLLLFSEDGIFTLEWRQSFSYIYFLGALPLLYFGYKSLK